MADWNTFLSAWTLALVRVSAMVLFAPFFSSNALPARTKAVFVLAVAYLLAPLVAGLPRAQTELGFAPVLGEVAVGLVYGLSLALLNEMLLFAGQIMGMQFSFSLVNLMDPSSNIETPLMGKLSPQLPVMSLSIPVKTITGFVLLAGSLALWPRFIEARFAGLLDMAERLLGPGGAKG